MTEEQVLTILAGEMEKVGPIDEHGVPWNAAGWAARFHREPPWKKRIERLASTLPDRGDGWVYICRGDVFAWGGREACDLFLGAMAWGFGNRGYGWRRTRNILSGGRTLDQALEPESSTRIDRAISTIRQAAAEFGPAGAWRAWSMDGNARLPWLGTAFASKVAYFACYDRSAGSGPLIADLNTALVMWKLADLWDTRTSAVLYAKYVQKAEGWAKEMGCRSDEIERILFQLGPMS